MRDLITIITIVINVASMFAMIVGILLHSGRGGGLSDMFGGGLGATAAGSTVVEKNLDRITITTAIIWTVCLIVMMIAYPQL